MPETWLEYAVLDFAELEAIISSEGCLLAAIHRAFVDGNWMAVCYDRKGRQFTARGRNPHEAACKLAWELKIRNSAKQGSTGRK